MKSSLFVCWLLSSRLSLVRGLHVANRIGTEPEASAAPGAAEWKKHILSEQRCRGRAEKKKRRRSGSLVTTTPPRPHDAAIVYLVPSPDPAGRLNPARAESDWAFTLKSLRSLKNFEDQGRAEVRIFLDEEDNFTDDNIDELLGAATSSRDACIMRIKFRTFPDDFDPDATKSPWAVRSKWGYELMISFFFSGIIMSDALDGVKYWMRMDTDSYFKDPVQVDPFAILDTRSGLAYLHNNENKDHGDVTEGLCDFIREYAKNYSFPESYACQSSDQFVRGFFNNVEVGRISAFQTPAATDFMQAVQASRGIFTHRWGDALLRRILVEMLGLDIDPLPEAMLESYCHGSDE